MRETANADGASAISATPFGFERPTAVGARDAHAVPMRTASSVRERLTVGRADDPMEAEADAVAAQVVARLANVRIEPPALAAAGSRLRRAVWSGGGGEPAALTAEPRLRRADRNSAPHGSIGPEGGAVDPGLERRLTTAGGTGAALPDGTRARMERAFGADFSRVRVHEDGQAAQLSRELGATAFTIGSDIFVGDRAPDIDRPSGEHLLAHELTHTVQQGGASVSRPVRREAVSAEPAPATSGQMRTAPFLAPGSGFALQRHYGDARPARTTFATTVARDELSSASIRPGPAASVEQRVDRARVQRRFAGALGKMSDSEIFDAVRQQHPDAPERVQRLISAYRKHKTRRFDTLSDLTGAMDTSGWNEESQVERRKQQDETLARLKKQAKQARAEEPQRERVPQQRPQTKKVPSPEDLDLLLSTVRSGVSGKQGATGGSGAPTGSAKSEPEVDDSAAQHQLITNILGEDWFMREDLGVDDTSDRSSLFEQGREMKAVVADSGVKASTFGTLVASVGPSFGDAVTGQNVFASSLGEFLPAVIDGKAYRLIAGQDYLNTGVSATYKADAKEVRDGGVKLLRSRRGDGEEGQPEVRFVRDGHHRLIWAAFCHKQAIRVELSEAYGQVPFGGSAPTWATMKYQDDPTKAVKDAPPIKELKQKVLREWVSQQQPFARWARVAMQELDPFSAFATSSLAYHKFKSTPQMVDEIGRLIKAVMPVRTKSFFDAMLTTLVGRAKDKQTARNVEQFLRTSVPATTTKNLSICLGPTDSVGFYDTTAHAITLDPVKNPDADALLDTLSFEIQNAAARSKLALANKELDEKKRGEKVVAVEFDSDDKYVASLIEIHGATDIDDLVRNKLEIPSKFLVEADYRAVKNGTGKVELPDRSVLPRQNAREALWFWKTRGWTKSEQKEIWGGTEHAEGMVASTNTYGDKAQ